MLVKTLQKKDLRSGKNTKHEEQLLLFIFVF